MVSILIPNYNKAPYLRETLESVLAQTYTDWECIIVDDHSTDGSWGILETYSQKDSRIKIFKRPKARIKGVSSARNYAIEFAEGEYVAFLDSDDTWGPRRLELAFDFITSNNASAIFSGAMVQWHDSIYKYSSRDIRFGESVFGFIISKDVFCPTPSFILQREVVRNVMFDEYFLRHEDYDFFIRVHQIAKWKYFENFDVIINWSRPNLFEINYDFCLPFYKRHLKELTTESIDYLFKFSSQVARYQPGAHIIKFFDQILKENNVDYNFKQWVLFNYPLIFNCLSKVKKFKFSLGLNK